MSEEDKREREIDLVVISMQRFAQGSFEYQRIQSIWHEASLSGALREGFPPGTEEIAHKWRELVTECRTRVQ